MLGVLAMPLPLTPSLFESFAGSIRSLLSLEKYGPALDDQGGTQGLSCQPKRIVRTVSSGSPSTLAKYSNISVSLTKAARSL
jgi:hypothetical protein